MPIRIQCPSPDCRATCKANESLSGRQVRCPKCGKTYLATPTLDGRSKDTGPGRPVPADDPFPRLPAEFGRYRVLKLLGQGGMGAVYRAHDTELDREVALKLPFFGPGDASVRAERFVREARSAAALQHANICTVFDVGQISGRAYITMALIDGTTLEAVIDPDAPMPQGRAAGIVRGLALALEHAHQKGIVHRDLKPSNVMLRADGTPVVMDFGLAKRAADADPQPRAGATAGSQDGVKLTRDGAVIGTPGYMSPEQVRGAAIGPASDIYSLGVMLYELLTGHPPYTGSLGVVMGQILSAPVPPVRDLRADADETLEAICRTAMAKSPAERYPTMAAMAAALDAYLAPPADFDVVLAEAPPAPRPAPVESRTPFDELGGHIEHEHGVPARRESTRPIAAANTRTKPLWKRPAAIALAVLLPLSMLAAAVVLRIETPNGTLLVEIHDPAVEARIKNGRLILSGPDGKDRYTLTAAERDKKVAAGSYKIRVEGADGLVLDTTEFTLKKGDKVTIRVSAVPPVVVAKLEPKKGPKDTDPVSPPDLVKKEPPGASPAPPMAETEPAKKPDDKGKDVEAKQPDKQPDDKEFVSIFNGKDLTGWKAHPTQPGKWRVEKGILIGSGADTVSHLYTTRNNYTDFHLRVEARLNGVGNSGIYARCPFGPVLPADAPRWPVGLNAKLDKDRLGGVYVDGFTRTATPRIPAGEWVTLEMVAKGNSTIVKVNDQTTADHTDAKRQFTTGHIALQLHNAATVVEFRKIEIKDLSVEPNVPPTKVQPAKEAPNPGADRKAAEYALSIGGTVRINNLDSDIKAAGDLPRAAFRLTCAHLGNNPKVNDADLAVFKGCKHLTDLSLISTAVTDAGVEHFSECKNLKKLDLAFTAVTGESLSHFKNLTDVVMARTRLSDAGMAYLNNCKGLATIHFGFTAIGDEGMAHLKDCTTLTFALIEGTRVTDAGVAHLKGCKDLEFLGVNATQVSDSTLAFLKDFKKLSTLRVSLTKVSEAGLAHLKGFKSLKDLEICNNALTDDALIHLKECKPLAVVTLDNNPVSDAGVVHLKNCVGLGTIRIRSTKITKMGKDELVKALPRCNVEWIPPPGKP